MNKHMSIKILAAAVAAAALALPAHAEFALDDETRGATVKVNDKADLNVRVRLQPRLDIGDLMKDAASGQYTSETDLYVRRIRLELTGQLVKNLKYKLTFNGDKDDQRDATTGRNAHSTFGLQYAYFDYKFADVASLLFGQSKLPLSRVSLTSSSRQLLIERPFSTEAAKNLFGNYLRAELMLHGKIADGVFSYMLAIADGGDSNRTGTGTGLVNPEGSPAYFGRLEFSPPGWTEKKKSSADFSLHIGGFTAQAEFNQWTVGQTGSVDIKPQGWYTQVGYFIPGANLEPVARHEIYDHDSNAVTDREDTYTTLGFNWYFKPRFPINPKA